MSRFGKVMLAAAVAGALTLATAELTSAGASARLPQLAGYLVCVPG